MPRLPSCCQQHSPCSGPSPGHTSLSHSHSSCLQASSSQQTAGSQHSNTHHFVHHIHHPAPQPPGTLPFQEPSCPVERPSALPAPCAGVNNSNGSSSNAAHYHDQVSKFVANIKIFSFYNFFIYLLYDDFNLIHNSDLNQKTRLFRMNPQLF